MTLLNILLLAIIIAVAYQFWRLRGIAEYARLYVNQYCDRHQLQLLNIARGKTRLSGKGGKLDWHCEFEFAFSGNGEDAQTGTINMQGLKVVNTDLPAYRVD